MPYPEIEKGSPQTITLTQPASGHDPIWLIADNSGSTYAKSSEPHGISFSPTGTPGQFLIDLPLSTPSFTQAYVIYTVGPGAAELYDRFAFVDPPPPPPKTGFNLRLINLPFRRRRPAKSVQKT